MKDIFNMTFEELVNLLPIQYRKKINQLHFLRERPDFHPEPSCYEHIKIVTTRLQKTENVDLVFTGLFHDIFKLDCAKVNRKTGWVTSPGHGKRSAIEIRENIELQQLIFLHGGNWERVADLCEQHMRIKQIDSMRRHKQDALRSMEIFDDLSIFTQADNMLNDFNGIQFNPIGMKDVNGIYMLVDQNLNETTISHREFSNLLVIFNSMSLLNKTKYYYNE